MAKKVKEEAHEEIQEAPKPENKSPKLFICNVNHNNKEYKAGQEWIGEVPKELEQFIK